MGKKIALFLLLALTGGYLSAQDTTYFFEADEGYRKSIQPDLIFGVTGGFGKSFQSDLVEINENVKNSLNFNAEMTDHFPVTLYYGMYLLFRLNKKIFIGPDYQYHTTGSRLAYRDYSGTYTFDQILSAHALAIRVEGTQVNRKNSQFCISASFGILLSTWNISENLVVGEQHESSETSFDALRPFVYPALKFRYRIAPWILLSPSLGCNFDLFGKYHLHDMKESKTDKIASWAGPRAELSINFLYRE